MLAASRQKTLSQSLATWATTLTLDDVPDDVIHAGKRAIVDTIAVAIAGSNMPVRKKILHHAIENYGPGRCVALGTGEHLSPLGATLANGVAAHALDFDDMSYAGIIHGSIIILPAVLAAVEQQNGTGRALLEAFIAGAECAYAIGLTVTDSHYLKGWWATASCGMIGAAAGASKALSLDDDQTTNAISLAAVQAFGMIAILGTDAKPTLAGRAAMSGLEAALLAGEGLSAPARAFEDKRGFLALMNDGTAYNEGLAQLGRTWRLTEPGIFFKTYPVCSAAHAAAQLTERLLRENGLGFDDIENILCDVPHLVAISLVHDAPATPSEAQFSMPFAIGCILSFGALGPEQISSDCLADQRLRDAMAKVRMSEADDLNLPEIAKRTPECARVTIKTKNGATISDFLGAPAGMPENPLSDDDLSNKFRRCCEFAGWPASRSDGLLDDLWTLETAPNLSQMLRGDVS
ncbi:hypothetical protein MnTg02_01616 [bacterium MnTg02]|nr:hypothetical protein MnTg02_01616 [bacterium MnTg02]